MSINKLMTKLGSLGCKGYPTSAQFELTHRCNGSCAYCYLIGEQQPDPPLSTLLDIITTLKENGILFLFLTGGELFIRPDILDILQHAVNCDFFEISLLSNGTLIKKQHIDFISRHTSHIKKIQLSVFSDREDENDTYMGIPGATRKTLDSARQLIRAGIQVSLSLNIQPFNVNRIGDILEFYETSGFTINFSPYVIVTNHNEKELKDRDTYEFYRQLFLGLGEQYLKRFRNALNKKISAPRRTELCSGRLCMILVDPQGTIYPCTSFRYYPLGNIVKEPSLKKLYTSEKVNTLHALSITDYPKCADCEYLNFCSLCIGRWHTRFRRFGMIDNHLCNYVHALADVLNERK